MIDELNNISSLARTATAQAKNCLNTIQELQAAQDKSYKRVSAAIDAALEVLNEIKA